MMTDEQLRARDAKRNIGAELLVAVRELQANCHESRPTPRMMKETRGWRCYGRCRENSLGACIPIANLARPH